MAEAILAGIACRPCKYTTPGKVGPSGEAIVRKPVIAGAFVDLQHLHLTEATVGILAVQLLKRSPNEALAPAKFEVNRADVDEALQYYNEDAIGEDRVPRWLLLDDELLAQPGEHAQPDGQKSIPVAVAVLGRAIPRIRILRMGKGVTGEIGLAFNIGAMWRKRS